MKELGTRSLDLGHRDVYGADRTLRLPLWQWHRVWEAAGAAVALVVG